MKKVLFAFVALILLLILSVFLWQFSTPLSTVTVRNLSGDEISKVRITYDDKTEQLGKFNNGQATTLTIRARRECGVELSYQSSEGIEHHSKAFYLEPRGYRVTLSLRSDGQIEARMELDFGKLKNWLLRGRKST